MIVPFAEGLQAIGIEEQQEGTAVNPLTPLLVEDWSSSRTSCGEGGSSCSCGPVNNEFET